MGANVAPSAWVGACSWTVALGRVGVLEAGGLRALVGAVELARRIVGAGDTPLLPAGRSAIVGAGAVGVGGAPGTGGRTVGATEGRADGASGTVAEGTAGGASAAFNVTRTVSFFSGTLEVCLDGTGGWLSFSVMCAREWSA